MNEIQKRINSTLGRWDEEKMTLLQRQESEAKDVLSLIEDAYNVLVVPMTGGVLDRETRKRSTNEALIAMVDNFMAEGSELGLGMDLL